MAHAISEPPPAGSASFFGSGVMLPAYPLKQLTRPTLRALSAPLKRGFTLADVRAVGNKLAQVAATQDLQTLEQPLLTLVSDPTQQTRFWWSWEMVMPVRGKVEASEGIVVTRVHGGTYAQVTTNGGFDDLPNLYAHMLGEVLPFYRHELTRPAIYHRLLSGLEAKSLDQLSLAALIPINLSIGGTPPLLKRPQHD